MIPVVVAALFTEGNKPVQEAAAIIGSAVLFILVAVGVFLIVRCSVIWGGYQRLLQEGDYTVSRKVESKRNDRLSTIYWCLVVTAYLAVSFLTGMFMCLLSGYISGFFNILMGVTLDETAVYLSPVVEEIMKLLPMLFYMLALDLDRNGMALSAVALGVGFATFENCCYILQAGAENTLYSLIRGLAVGVMHVICMLLLNLGIALARRYRIVSLPSMIGALSVSMTFHGLYNLLVSGPQPAPAIGYAMPIVTAALLYGLYRSTTGKAGEKAPTD